MLRCAKRRASEVTSANRKMRVTSCLLHWMYSLAVSLAQLNEYTTKISSVFVAFILHKMLINKLMKTSYFILPSVCREKALSRQEALRLLWALPGSA